MQPRPDGDVRRINGMLRITRLDASTRATVLRLEGRLTRTEVAELETVLDLCRRQRRRVVLDLAGIVFVDAAGAQALRACGRGRIDVVGASSFVQHILREEQP